MSLSTSLKSSYKTKYGFFFSFSYYITTRWFYSECEISVFTKNKKNLVFYKKVKEEEYNAEIEKIQQKILGGYKIKEFVKDYGKCLACKKRIDSESDEWLYEEYDMFCSRICLRKPIADKCTKCKTGDIPRNYDWEFPGYCKKSCFLENLMVEKINIPRVISKYIVEKL